ncbi:MAG: hypothetical protein ACQEWF_23140 [Bacillota bacterium]
MDNYKKFDKLLRSGKNEEILTFLNEFRNSRALTVEEKGWVYWNISDILAIMREPQLEYENHIEFVEWGKKALAPDKLHWFVSDGTQALTLSLGNYFDEWYDWYLYACKHSSKSKANRGIRFESHRTTISSLIMLDKFSKIDVPFNNMFELINEEKDWENNLFAEYTYYTLLLEKAYKMGEQELVKDALENINHLTEHNVKEILNSNIKKNQDDYVLGSWQQLNSSRLSKASMTVLLHNLGCTLNSVERYKESVAMFQLALQNRVSITPYGLALYLLSIWKVDKSSEKVLRTYKKLNRDWSEIKELIKFAPELKNVNWQ